MALVHMVVLKPSAVVADAYRRFKQRPLALWVVGAISALPALATTPTPMPDFDNLEAYAAQMPSTQDLQVQLVQGAKVGLLAMALSALAWPVITLLTQGVPTAELLGLATNRMLVAAKAFGGALVALVALSVAMMVPSVVVYALSHHRGDPWIALPGIEAMGFWFVAVLNGLVTALVVSLFFGALMVVPAEACTHPAAPQEVLTRSWNMCRAYLFPITGLLTWIGGILFVASFVTDAFEELGGVGRILSWAAQGALATIAPLCGASLHQSLSEQAQSSTSAAQSAPRP